MIRKFARIIAPQQMLIRIFADHERWPLWMPGIERATTVQRTDELVIVDLEQHQMGRRFNQRVQCQVVGSTVRQQQITGLFKRWQAIWSFGPAPGGAGTIVSCELDVDLGMIALLAPARLVQDGIDRIFDETVGGAQREVHLQQTAFQEGIEAEGETLLEVYESQGSIEVWVAGRRIEFA